MFKFFYTRRNTRDLWRNYNVRRNTKEEDRFDNKSLLGRQDTGPVCRIEAERMDVTLVVGKQIQGEYTRRGDDFLSMDNA